jgi:hypothetical protein
MTVSLAEQIEAVRNALRIAGMLEWDVAKAALATLEAIQRRPLPPPPPE